MKVCLDGLVMRKEWMIVGWLSGCIVVSVLGIDWLGDGSESILSQQKNVWRSEM